MKNSVQKTFKSKLIFGKYSIKNLIAKGSCGEVYLGTNILNNKQYALKLEKTTKSESLLKEEAYKLLFLKGPGLPSVISFGLSGKYHVLVENLLGKSIYEIWLEKKKKLNLKDTCMFAIQALERIEYVHSKNYLHRDIKPANFLVGNPDKAQIYLIDFGNARKYRSSRTGKHLACNKNYKVFGTIIFLSLNALKGIEQTRKDELESLGLVFIYLYQGFLPWSDLKIKDIQQTIKMIIKAKAKISIEELCSNLPEEICDYMNYVKNMNFDENPNYKYLKTLFLNILRKIGEKNDLIFSWVDKKMIPKKIITRNNKSLQKLYINILSSYSNKMLNSFNTDITKTNTLNNRVDTYFKDNQINVIYSNDDNNDKKKINAIQKLAFINNEHDNEKILKKSQKLNIKKSNTYNTYIDNKRIKLEKNKENLNMTNFNSKIKIPINNIDKERNPTNLNFKLNQNIISNNNYLTLIGNKKSNNDESKKKYNLKLKNNNIKIRNCININNVNINKLPNNNYQFITSFKKLDKQKINIKPNIRINQERSEIKQIPLYTDNNNNSTKKSFSSNLHYKPCFYKSIFSSPNDSNKDLPLQTKQLNIKQSFPNLKSAKFNIKSDTIKHVINQRDLKKQINSKNNIYNPLFNKDNKDISLTYNNSPRKHISLIKKEK